MKNTIKASEIIRNSWDWHGKSTQEFNIDGKIIKTNLNGSDQYWNGTDIPEKYTRAKNGIHYKAHKSRAEELDDCIAEGFDEIRFVLYASKMIRGYCEVFVWAHKSTEKKAQEEKKMKRYYVYAEVKSNFYIKNLRFQTLASSYVYSNSQKDAISSFWETLSKNKEFPYMRHLLKITAERWDENELDCNGNPMKDMETALTLDQLAVAVWNREKKMMEMPVDALELADEPQESSEPVAQENIQPEPEDATEAKSEPQRSNRWNVSVFFSKDQILDELWRLRSDLSSGDVVGCTKRHEHQMNRFIKALDVAIDVINEMDEISQRASQSSSDEEKEITRENAEELTESKSEGKVGITTSMIAVGNFLVIEERKNDALWAYYHGDDFLWSSAQRFSKDDLLRMYENGYFMEELKKLRGMKHDAIHVCKDFPDEIFVRMRNELDLIDDEIARLFINGARM